MSTNPNTPDTLQHFNAGQVNGVRITPTPRHSSATGYGSKIPTGYMLQTFGPRPVWRRVYVINYGNAGSAYVLISGARHYLTPGVELILETVRDGGTLEGARELMSVWPVWMKEAEGLPAYAADSPAAIAARGGISPDVFPGATPDDAPAPDVPAAKTVAYTPELFAALMEHQTDYLQTGWTVCGAEDPAVIMFGPEFSARHPEYTGFTVARVLDRYVSPWKSDTLIAFSTVEPTDAEYALNDEIAGDEK